MKTEIKIDTVIAIDTLTNTFTLSTHEKYKFNVNIKLLYYKKLNNTSAVYSDEIIALINALVGKVKGSHGNQLEHCIWLS